MCGILGAMSIVRLFIATSGLIAIMASASLAGPNCTCRFSGQNYKTGEIACIRGKLSRCEFVLNNTSWKTIAETCPQVSLPEILQSPDVKLELTVLAKMQNRFLIK